MTGKAAVGETPSGRFADDSDDATWRRNRQPTQTEQDDNGSVRSNLGTARHNPYEREAVRLPGLEPLDRSVEGVLASAENSSVVVVAESFGKLPGQRGACFPVRWLRATEGLDEWSDGRGVYGTNELHFAATASRWAGTSR